MMTMPKTKAMMRQQPFYGYLYHGLYLIFPRCFS